MELMPCPARFWRLQEETSSPLYTWGRLREEDNSVLQEIICVSLPMATAMACPSSPQRLPVPSSDFLQTHSHVFSEVKWASSSPSLCFALSFCLWLWLSLPYLLVLRERHWQFIYVLYEDYAHTQQAGTALCLLTQRWAGCREWNQCWFLNHVCLPGECRNGFLVFKCPVLNVNCYRMGFLPQLLWNFIEVSRNGRRGENGKRLCRASSWYSLHLLSILIKS